MIHFAFSLRGTDHEERGRCCEDCSRTFSIPGGCGLVIADGVGSASMAAFASATACKEASSFIRNYFPPEGDRESLLSLLRCAMNRCLSVLIRAAEYAGMDPMEFATTLSIVLQTPKGTCIAHAGDGGIIGLNAVSGDYDILASPVKGEDGHLVVPLQGGPGTWIIRDFDESYASVMASTDGLLDALYLPPLMKYAGEETGVYPYELQKVMDLAWMEKRDLDPADLKEYLIARFEREDRYVTGDDKTLAVLIDPSVKAVRRSGAYYRKQDFALLEMRRDGEIRRQMESREQEIEKADAVSEKKQNLPSLTMEKEEEKPLPVSLPDPVSFSRERPVRERNLSKAGKSVEKEGTIKEKPAGFCNRIRSFLLADPTEED